MSHHTLDARGLLCPMPVIRTQDKVETLNHGDTLEIVCSDPGANSDIPAWCRITGHKFLSTNTNQDNNDIVIQVEVVHDDVSLG